MKFSCLNEVLSDFNPLKTKSVSYTYLVLTSQTKQNASIRKTSRCTLALQRTNCFRVRILEREYIAVDRDVLAHAC